jgi:hypothetical protein
MSTCAVCECEMNVRVRRLYCSEACTSKAYRRRKARGETKPQGRRGHTLPESVSAKMSDAELDELIAQMRPTMPANTDEEEASPPEAWTVPVVRCGKRWNGRYV